MSEKKICRICLQTEAKMYHFNVCQLKYYYEEIIALQVNEADGLPQYFCYECARMLHKFHKFKEKCYTGQKILKEMLWRGPITYESVYKIDRKGENIKSHLSINDVHSISISVRKQIKHKLNINSDIVAKEEPDYYSEASLTDREGESNESVDEEKISFIYKDDINASNKKEIVSYNQTVKLKDNEVDTSEPSNKRRIKNNHEVILINEVLEKENSASDNAKIKFDVDENDTACSPVVYAEAINVSKVEYKKMSKKDRKRTSNDWKIKKIEQNTKDWKITVLNEEEALKEFRAKAEDKKYLAAAFKCTDCFRGFSKKDMLNRHVQLRHIEQLGKYECRFCRYRYRLECFLNKHNKQHYTRYECLKCNLLCHLENTAILHEAYHSGITRKCTYCDEEFRHASTYYTHLRTHRSEHVCTLCGVSFVSQLGLKQHKHIKHCIIEIESPDDDEEVNTYCKRCDIRFETRKAYEEHLFHSALHSDEWKEATSDVESDGEKKRNIESVIKSTESSEQVSASKKILGKKEQAKITKELSRNKNVDDPFGPLTKLNRRLKRERRLRTKPTTCYQCGKHFETQAACLKHHTEAHPRTSFFPPNERYICEICGSSLAPGSIVAHQNMHTREKLHPCSTCGKQFYTMVGLKRHLVTHTGEKRFACTLCDKRFTQSNSMKLHHRTFHLKQPYPKRNRQKKKELKESVGLEQLNSEESSVDSLPDAEPRKQPGIEPGNHAALDRPEDTMHYLTLT